MHQNAVLLSIPGLRKQDLASMPRLSALAEKVTPLEHSFPCVTCPAQVTLTTGKTAEQHGVIANGFYWRDNHEVEMWTAWNEKIESPQIWQTLKEHNPELTSAVWFPLLSKGASADTICTPAPIHNPDGSESLWCYTVPQEMYGELRDELGHFPLMNFWGPMSNIKSTTWIIESAVVSAKKNKPRFSYIYLPHLDYAAQKFGPDSEQAQAALGELDAVIGTLIDGYEEAGLSDTLWLVASEYVITPVDEVSYPNRILREAGYLQVIDNDGEVIDFENSRAWALVDHQFAHVFVKDDADIEAVEALLSEDSNVEKTFTGSNRSEVNLDHERSGEIVLLSKPNAWFAYYYWLDDSKAPAFAHTVDIHRKPGYDPVEMYIDMPSKKTPLDATLIQGSHGYPADCDERRGILISSDVTTLSKEQYRDVDVAGLILDNFGVES